MRKKGFGSAKRSVVSLAICALIMLSFVLTLLPLTPAIRAESLGTWTATTDYPVSVEGSSCAISGGYIYCVGGWVSGSASTSTYYAPISSEGIGAWTQTTDYPTGLYLSSCVISGGYITCVGGLVASGEEGSAVYSAPVSSEGIGAWVSEGSYPTDLEASSCIVSGGYITCVGGLTGIGVNTNAVYYASLSSGTVGTWTATTDYPISVEGESCVGTSGYITCVGGQYDPLESGYVTDAIYYDTVSSGAVGATWSSTTNAPSELSYAPCVVSGGYIYCVGGFTSSGDATNYNTISSGELGASWTSTTTYPTPTVTMQCAVAGGYIYCVGGETDIAYYSAIGSSVTSTTTSSTTTSSTTTSSTTTSSTTTSSTTTSYSPPHENPPPPNTCQNLLQCYTAFVVFDVTQSGTPLGDVSIVLSANGVTSQSSTTTSSASTSLLCTLSPAWTAEWGTYWGCFAGESGQFAVVVGMTYTYTATLPNGGTMTGSVVVTDPWTVLVVNLAA